MENNIEEDIKILEEFKTNGYSILLMKYEDRIKTNRKIEQALEHIVSDYKRVLKENEILKEEKEQAWEEWNNLEQGSYQTEQNLKKQLEKLRIENDKLRAIRHETKYGMETTYLIPKERLIEINTNKYIVEIENGKFVDLKEVYQENEELNNRCRNLDKEAQAYLEELAGDNTLTRRTIKQLQEENEELKNKENKIYKEVQENLAFEKFLIVKERKPDLFNQGRFYISQIIYDILNDVQNPEGIHKENKCIQYIDYIPVQKVKEKIEELDKEEKRELKGTKGQDRYYIKQKYMYKRKVLEELLERTG